MNPEDIPAPLKSLLVRYRGGQPRDAIRKPGRPKKRTPEYLSSLLRAHAEIHAWYLTATGRKATSDCQLYAAFFNAVFIANGERPSRATEPGFQGAFKTLRNELAEARRQHRLQQDMPRDGTDLGPGNGSISGMASNVE
jgi:hypothetical protein